MKRISLLALLFFCSLISLQGTCVYANESRIRMYLDFVWPIFGEDDGKAKAIAGLTFKNLTSNKLRVPFLAVSGKGGYDRDYKKSSLPNSIFLYGQFQPSSDCAAITCEWIDSRMKTVLKTSCLLPSEPLILAAGDANTFEFVTDIPCQPGIYKLMIHFDNQALRAISRESNSRLLDEKLNGQSVFLQDSVSADVELKATKPKL